MIRLLIVDPVRLTGSLMAAALGQEPDLHIVGCATGVRDALAKLPGSDIVLLNATLPDPGFLALTRTLLAVNPAARIVMVGLPDSEEVIVQSIEAGISGYVLRIESLDELLANIRAVYHGQTLVSPAIAAVMILHASRLAELAHDQRLLQSHLKVES